MRFTLKLLALPIIIIVLYFVSHTFATGLDDITVIDSRRIVSNDCKEIGRYRNQGYNLGRCELELTQFGWPLTTREFYRFIKFERPNLKHGIVVNEDHSEDNRIDTVQLRPQLSQPELLCGSKSCVFVSDNQVVVFITLLIGATVPYVLWFRRSK